MFESSLKLDPEPVPPGAFSPGGGGEGGQQRVGSVSEEERCDDVHLTDRLYPPPALQSDLPERVPALPHRQPVERRSVQRGCAGRVLV